MNAFTRLFLSFLAAAFLASAPVMAADLSNLGVAKETKPDIGAALKDKAAEAVEQAKDKADSAAENIQDALGKKKADTMGKTKQELVDVKEESVTVQTPQGEAQATEITVTPEGAAPAPNK